MFEKELLEKDVLNRIRWDDGLHPGDFTVCYVDRFSQELKEVDYSDVLLDGDYLLVNESRIPVHRIREIKFRGEVAWARRRIQS